jgi:ABC-type nitrate/sulfonate/bicarbonate transport system permease component
MQQRLAKLGIVLLFLGGWEILSRVTHLLVFPSLLSLAHYLPSALPRLLLVDANATVQRLLLTYVIGTALGISVGAGLYFLGSLGEGFNPIIDFSRSVPGTAMFPFFLALIGLGTISVLLPATWVVFWITLFTSREELTNAASQRLDYLKRHNADWRFILRHLHLHALARSIFTNARLVISLALAVIVAMEMLAGPNSGLGYFIKIKEETPAYEEMVLGMLVAGIIGYISNSFLRWLESRLLNDVV